MVIDSTKYERFVREQLELRPDTFYKIYRIHKDEFERYFTYIKTNSCISENFEKLTFIIWLKVVAQPHASYTVMSEAMGLSDGDFWRRLEYACGVIISCFYIGLYNFF